MQFYIQQIVGFFSCIIQIKIEIRIGQDKQQIIIYSNKQKRRIRARNVKILQKKCEKIAQMWNKNNVVKNVNVNQICKSVSFNRWHLVDANVLNTSLVQLFSIFWMMWTLFNPSPLFFLFVLFLSLHIYIYIFSLRFCSVQFYIFHYSNKLIFFILSCVVFIPVLLLSSCSTFVTIKIPVRTHHHPYTLSLSSIRVQVGPISER
jgi:hypothetical protein